MATRPHYGTQDVSENDQQSNPETQSIINKPQPDDEERPLLGHSDETTPTVKPVKGVGTIIGVLLLGMALYLGTCIIILTFHAKVNLFLMLTPRLSWPLPGSFPPNSIVSAMQVGFQPDIHWDFVLLNQWYVVDSINFQDKLADGGASMVN